MGYTHFDKSVARLSQFLTSTSPYAWTLTKSSGYDFKYTSKEFIRELFNAAKIDSEQTKQTIQEIHKREDAIKEFPDYEIFLDTVFRRKKGQPIFVLACLEWKRHIFLDKEILIDLDSCQMIEYARSLVKLHYKETGGDIGIWGKVKYYTLYENGRKISVFQTDGSTAPIDIEILKSQATLTVGGKDILPVLTG